MQTVSRVSNDTALTEINALLQTISVILYECMPEGSRNGCNAVHGHAATQPPKPPCQTMRKPRQSSKVPPAALSLILQERSEQRDFCDVLELIADQLGGPVDPNPCTSALHRLRHDMPLYHRDEEVLFDILHTKAEDDRVITRCLELIVAEHAVHEAYLFDLAEPLTEMCAGKQVRDTHAVGYMLRCCFEGIRTHLNWEDATLLGDRLDVIAAEHAEDLAAGVARNRRVLARHLRIAG